MAKSRQSKDCAVQLMSTFISPIECVVTYLTQVSGEKTGLSKAESCTSDNRTISEENGKRDEEKEVRPKSIVRGTNSTGERHLGAAFTVVALHRVNRLLNIKARRNLRKGG